MKDRRTARYIAARLDRLAQGHTGDSKSVGDEVSELRIHQGAGYRIYFTRHKSTIIVLLCGGDKDSQPHDIKLAKRLVKQWKDENHD